MTPPTDTLETALRAVALTQIATCASGCHTEAGGPDYAALAAAAREWVQRMMPLPFVGHPGCAAPGAGAYNMALADVARKLGL